jgi:hypothetical protein
MSLLEVLARVQLADGPSSQLVGASDGARQPAAFAALLRQEAQSFPWGTTLSVITGTEGQALLDTLLYLRRAGFAVTLILVQPARATARVRAYAKQLAIPVHRVWREGDLGALQ